MEQAGQPQTLKDLAQRLVDEGQVTTFPAIRELSRELRDAVIDRAIRASKTKFGAARLAGVTTGRIYQYLARHAIQWTTAVAVSLLLACGGARPRQVPPGPTEAPRQGDQELVDGGVAGRWSDAAEPWWVFQHVNHVDEVGQPSWDKVSGLGVLRIGLESSSAALGSRCRIYLTNWLAGKPMRMWLLVGFDGVRRAERKRIDGVDYPLEVHDAAQDTVLHLRPDLVFELPEGTFASGQGWGARRVVGSNTAEVWIDLPMDVRYVGANLWLQGAGEVEGVRIPVGLSNALHLRLGMAAPKYDVVAGRYVLGPEWDPLRPAGPTAR